MARIGIYIRSIAKALGAEQTCVHIACGLADRGHAVDFLLEEVAGRLCEELERHPKVTIVDLAAGRGSWWSRRALQARAWWGLRSDPPRGLAQVLLHDDPPLLALRRYVEASRPAALLSFLNYPNASLLLAAPFCPPSTRYGVDVQNHISTAGRHSHSAWNRNVPHLMRGLFGRADFVIAPSRGVAEDVREITGLEAGRIHVVPNPLPAGRIRRLLEEAPAHPWLRDPEVPVVLGIGKLKPQKDFATLLRAFARVRAKRPARLVILGEGSERPALEALARELGIPADVDLPGHVDNPFPLLRRAGVFVLSSAWEGFANVVLEALACGCPIVSTDCPSGPAEILDGGKLAPLVPVGDAEAMARAILEVLGAPPARERLRARAADYSLEASVAAYERCLLGAPGAEAPA